MSALTTHVLDTARGRPAEGVPVSLEKQTSEGGWRTLGRGKTDADGRLRDLLPQEQKLARGVHRLTFDTATYFDSLGLAGFYPEVSVTFSVEDASQHYHVPLLLSPFGYSTYRGS